MKIALCGAQCTGKTTLMDELEKNKIFRDYKFCDEIARDIMRMGFEINKKGDNDTQLMIMTTHLQNLLCNENLVTDRCLIDGYSYSQYSYEIAGTVDEWVNEFSKKLTKEYSSKYDIIFYLKPEFKIVDDGVRSIDVNWQNAMVDYFDMTINILENVNIVRLTGTVEERVNSIINKINSL